MRLVGTRTVAIVALVTSAAVVGTAAMEGNQSDVSCSCATVDLESGSVTLVVLTEGIESSSVSQRVSQTNGQVDVSIDVEYGETAVEIAGETAPNGSLVLNATRNGEIVNETVISDASETGVVAFRIGPDGIKVDATDETPSACRCEAADGIAGSDAERGDGGGGDVNVNAGNVEVNVPVLESGNSSASSEQIIRDGSGSRSDDANGSNDDCEAERLDGDSRVDASRSDRSSNASGSAVNELRVVIQSNGVAGLRTVGCDRDTALGSVATEFSRLFGGEEES
jgi:hypothetical protein